MPSFTRSELLEEAANLVDGDRNVDYGDPIQDFSRTGSYWGIHIAAIFARRLHLMGFTEKDDINYNTIMGMLETIIEPHDVAIMMMQLKQSRLAWSPEKVDHWIDAAGYAACGWDCVEREDDYL